MRIITDLFAWTNRERSRVEHHFDLRLSHARSRIDRRAGSRLHPGQRHRLRAGRPSTPASTWTSSPRGFPSSSTRTTIFWKRSPSSAPPAACGPASCASVSRRRIRARWMLRFHTQTAGSTLTAQQPENNIVRTALQALAAVLGRHPVAAHQFLRRSARPAHRAGRPHRAAHPADRRLRVRRSADRRSPGRFVLHRSPDQRNRNPRGGLSRTRSKLSAA